jgi:hypothetical protein
MILLYTLLLCALGVALFLVDRKVRSLERKYTRVALEANRLAQEPAHRPGNSNRLDPFLIAKRQYQLGVLAQKRDALETRQYRWQRAAERLSATLRRLRAWKGRKLPYTFGVVDVALVLCLVDHLGFSQYVSLTALQQMVERLLST